MSDYVTYDQMLTWIKVMKDELREVVKSEINGFPEEIKDNKKAIDELKKHHEPDLEPTWWSDDGVCQ